MCFRAPGAPDPAEGAVPVEPAGHPGQREKRGGHHHQLSQAARQKGPRHPGQGACGVQLGGR